MVMGNGELGIGEYEYQYEYEYDGAFGDRYSSFGQLRYYNKTSVQRQGNLYGSTNPTTSSSWTKNQWL
jgi:hypothetical protein